MFKVVTFLGVASMALAACPESCNGHGTCGANDICTCFDNWQGASCGDRTCAYEVAWSDIPSYTNYAHEMAECAGRGLCDRESGVCECFPGYEGKGCGRQTCPNGCSGHGTCEYIDEMASDDHPRFDGESSLHVTYTQWDAGHARICRCDAGFEGFDCSMRMCPKGDDALTTTKSGADVQAIRLYQTPEPHHLDSTATLRKGWNRVMNVTVDDFWADAAQGDRIRFGEAGFQHDATFAGYAKMEYTIAELSTGNVTIEEPIWWPHEEEGVSLHLSPSTAYSAWDASSEFYITYYDLYGGMWNTSMIDYDTTASTTAAAVEAALQELPVSLLKDVTVTATDDSTDGMASDGLWPRQALTGTQTMLVTFAAAAGQHGQQHLLSVNAEPHDSVGQFPRSVGVVNLGDGETFVAEVTREGTTRNVAPEDSLSESGVCGNRGICDSDEGICECFDGWRGLACGTQEALV